MLSSGTTTLFFDEFFKTPPQAQSNQLTPYAGVNFVELQGATFRFGTVKMTSTQG